MQVSAEWGSELSAHVWELDVATAFRTITAAEAARDMEGMGFTLPLTMARVALS